MLEPILVGLAVNLLSFISKKSKDSLKQLFSQDELESMLDQAFLEFKESSAKDKDKTDEEILKEVFELFFTHKETIEEFKQVFEAQSERVDLKKEGTVRENDQKLVVSLD